MKEKDTTKQATAQAQEELESLLRLMGFEARVEAFVQGDDEILLHIESPDAARLIGRGAQVLDALQYILNRTLYQRNAEALHCVVDVERYRERKKDHLLKETLEAADRVRQSGKPFRLAPMRAGERRIVHQALRDDPDLETYSEEPDEEGRKRVVIRLRSGGQPAPSEDVQSPPETPLA
ncbi:MAG: KH domain-containing protein [Kiritimatiellae bacterium]|nr:KH domain-containing protein [Kiritimatiellia bacterium]